MDEQEREQLHRNMEMARLRNELADIKRELAKSESGFFRSMSDEGKVILGILLITNLPLIVALIAMALGADL